MLLSGKRGGRARQESGIRPERLARNEQSTAVDGIFAEAARHANSRAMRSVLRRFHASQGLELGQDSVRNLTRSKL